VIVTDTDYIRAAEYAQITVERAHPTIVAGSS
jgi:hypothetical protein